MRNYGDPPEKKIDRSRAAFQGHSRSSELTRIDRLPMTSIRVPYPWACLVLFLRQTAISAENRKFPTPMYLNRCWCGLVVEWLGCWTGLAINRSRVESWPLRYRVQPLASC